MIVPPRGWSENEFGEEIFWVRKSKNIYLLFGRGPAQGTGSSLVRLQQLVKNPDFPFDSLVCAKQVHGSSIAVLGPKNAEIAGIHDGLMSTFPGRGLVVWTADCVPVLLSGGQVVSAVHAGWRGTAAGIIQNAVGLFQSQFGVSPDEISATIGPAIGACHYPVGPEVIEGLNRWNISDSSWLQDHCVDLRVFLRQQLLDFGLNDAAIEVVGPCTACDPNLASFRRDGEAAGRQVSVIGIRTPS